MKFELLSSFVLHILFGKVKTLRR